MKPRLEPLPFLPPPEVGWMKILGLWDLRGSTFLVVFCWFGLNAGFQLGPFRFTDVVERASLDLGFFETSG